VAVVTAPVIVRIAPALERREAQKVKGVSHVAPKKTKYRKQFKGRSTATAKGGSTLNFGS
jgi:hypothetical protein